MNEQEQQELELEQDLELEDILKEFSGDDQEPLPEDFLELFEELEAEVPGEAEEEASVTGDTVRLDILPHLVQEREEKDEEIPVQPEETEPYSEDWEPEYDQPMGEYIPPRPVLLPQRSRLRELKRKLVAGPEKRYYELSEQGIGRLQLAMLLNIVVVVLSGGATLLYAAGKINPDRIKLMIFGQFIALLVSALLGNRQLLSGLGDILRKRFTMRSLLPFTFAACLADGIFGLRELRVPCCAAFGLQVTMAMWSEYHRRTTQMGQMDTMRKATRLDSIVEAPDYYENKKGLLRSEGEVEDFMDNFDKPSTPEKVLNWYAFAALLVSIGAGVAGGVLHNSISFGVQVVAVSLLAAAPATAFITISRPEALLQKRLHQVGAVLCGWQGIRGLCGKAVFPVGHEDLFPAGSYNLNGVKFYGSRDTDQVVAYAAALVSADGGGLVPLFDYLLESRNGRHYTVEAFRYYNGGIGGEVAGESVLVGSLDFLKSMGVEIPQGTRVNQAVYVAVDGELCGLFAVNYGKDPAAAAGLATLCSSRRVAPVLTGGDFMLTDSFIGSRFHVNTRRMAFPEEQVRRAMLRIEPEEDSPSLALITGKGLVSYAYAIFGARNLRTAWIIGVVIHMVAGILGLAMMCALAYLGQSQLLTPANMLLYTLAWMVPGLLLSEWTRSI